MLHEQKTDLTPTDLAAIAANPAGPKANYKVITVGKDTESFNFSDTVGRIRLLHDGVMCDLTGPALPPADALSLASQVAPQ